jgi:hypothetical protein
MLKFTKELGMELRTFNSVTDVESYISDLIANDTAYHFDDDEYELFDSELADVLFFNTLQMRDYCEEHDIDPFELLVKYSK